MARKKRDELHLTWIAAARIQSQEAFEAALDLFVEQYSSRKKTQLDNQDIRKKIRRLGTDLGSALQDDFGLYAIRTLAQHPLPAVRCLAAWAMRPTWNEAVFPALAQELVQNEPVLLDCIGDALESLPSTTRQTLAENLLLTGTATERALGLKLIPVEPAEVALKHVASLVDMDDILILREAAAALNRIAVQEMGLVELKLLGWADRPPRSRMWVLTEALSHQPLARNLQTVKTILMKLSEHASREGEQRRIIRTLRSIITRDRSEVLAWIEVWRTSPQPHLQRLAKRALGRVKHLT
jgi:hypothetical protein